jgi:hypothetical protein
VLGGETDGTLDLEVLVLGAPDEISADCIGERVSWTCKDSRWALDINLDQIKGGNAPFSRFLTLRLVRVMRMRW